MISGGYVRTGPNTVRFDVGVYDLNHALVIDPTLVYSTFLGGSFEENGFGITVDALGNAYVAGLTTSTDFPVTSGPSDPPDQDA